MFRYVQEAAAKAGFPPKYLFCKTEKKAWETLSILPEGMRCLSSEDAASMKNQLQELEAVLLLWADAFSITPELIGRLVNGGPGCCLAADGTIVAAYCTGSEAAGLLMEDSISLSVNWLCYAPHELDPNCCWISTAPIHAGIFIGQPKPCGFRYWNNGWRKGSSSPVQMEL